MKKKNWMKIINKNVVKFLKYHLDFFQFPLSLFSISLTHSLTKQNHCRGNKKFIVDILRKFFAFHFHSIFTSALSSEKSFFKNDDIQACKVRTIFIYSKKFQCMLDKPLWNDNRKWRPSVYVKAGSRRCWWLAVKIFTTHMNWKKKVLSKGNLKVTAQIYGIRKEIGNNLTYSLSIFFTGFSSLEWA